jgi:hypothetical protein
MQWILSGHKNTIRWEEKICQARLTDYGNLTYTSSFKEALFHHGFDKR